MREEVKSLYVEAGDVDTHPKITETKLLETAKPATKLPPRQSAAVRLREERLRDGLLDDEALRWSLRPQKPPLLQLQEFALVVHICRIGLNQFHEEEINLTAK
jgi:hypothetical protein